VNVIIVTPYSLQQSEMELLWDIFLHRLPNANK
jgi:hypothetical protein